MKAMKVIRIIKMEAEVKECGECPYHQPSKEFTICEKLEEDGVQFPDTIIDPAWNRTIDKKCPLKGK